MFKLSEAQKEILKLLPQKAVKLVPFGELVKMGSKVAASALVGESYFRDVERLTLKGVPAGVVVVCEDLSVNKAPLEVWHGEKILEIYFSQLSAAETPVHLDMRTSFFAPRGTELLWRPSPLRYSFSEKFLLSVRQLYVGFYNEDLAVFDQGLEGLGMTRPSMAPAKRIEIRDLLFAHFGEGRTAPVHFSVPKFQKSFDDIFSYFLRNEIPLHPEFALLGANLVTLYSTLQSIDAPLNVRGAFVSSPLNS